MTPRLVLPLLLFSALCLAEATVIKASAWDCAWKVRELKPGDTLQLEPDDYGSGLTIQGLHGKPDDWITIRGPVGEEKATFLGATKANRNTVVIRDSSYVALENLQIDGRNVPGVFAISAKGGQVHHIRIENCTIIGHGAHQQTVAISTKAPAWGWVIRGNRILGAGTGMYLGDSDGSKPFFASVIEHNLISEPKGYCLQIKHQIGRPGADSVPKGPQVTIIRHNVFLKAAAVGESGARPNVLLGGFPDSGPGSEDNYEIYGNLFCRNPDEALLQFTGRAMIHDNIFADCKAEAISFRDHAGKQLKRAFVLQNTFFAVQAAAKFHVLPRQDHFIAGNLVLARTGFRGRGLKKAGNTVGSLSSASLYVTNPTVVLGEMDLYPRKDRCGGSPIDLDRFAEHVDFDLDFNGTRRADRKLRGAYAGEGTNPGWRLAAEIKPAR